MDGMGFPARFSISWTRVYPLDASGNMYKNELGVQFYKLLGQDGQDGQVNPCCELWVA